MRVVGDSDGILRTFVTGWVDGERGPVVSTRLEERGGERVERERERGQGEGEGQAQRLN